MKIKENFDLRKIGENHIVVPVGAQTVDFRCMITLNETGAFLWKELTTDKTEEQLTEALLAEYDVTPDIARTDVQQFIVRLKESNLLV